LKMCDSVA